MFQHLFGHLFENFTQFCPYLTKVSGRCHFKNKSVNYYDNVGFQLKMTQPKTKITEHAKSRELLAIVKSSLDSSRSTCVQL